MKRFNVVLAVILAIVIPVVLVEVAFTAWTEYNGSNWLPAIWLLSFGTPMMAYPLINLTIAIVLGIGYVFSVLPPSSGGSLYFGAMAWFATLIAAVSDRGLSPQQETIAITLFGIVSVAVLAHSGYTILRRR